ncbi:hypothetical protein BSKO_12263 [Bryopsis sp. KO-2023]|nr:hypothetical protein BSKO_12263 [Bryopsis sp. KO-2023]
MQSKLLVRSAIRLRPAVGLSYVEFLPGCGGGLGENSSRQGTTVFDCQVRLSTEGLSSILDSHAKRAKKSTAYPPSGSQGFDPAAQQRYGSNPSAQHIRQPPRWSPPHQQGQGQHPGGGEQNWNGQGGGGHYSWGGGNQQGNGHANNHQPAWNATNSSQQPQSFHQNGANGGGHFPQHQHPHFGNGAPGGGHPQQYHHQQQQHYRNGAGQNANAHLPQGVQNGWGNQAQPNQNGGIPHGHPQANQNGFHAHGQNQQAWNAHGQPQNGQQAWNPALGGGFQNGQPQIHHQQGANGWNGGHQQPSTQYHHQQQQQQQQPWNPQQGFNGGSGPGYQQGFPGQQRWNQNQNQNQTNGAPDQQNNKEFWKVEVDSGPGGEYDSRWAKKMENKFGGNRPSQASPAQRVVMPIYPPNPDQRKPRAAKKEPPKEITLPEDVTVKQLASKLGVHIEKLEAVLIEFGEQPQSHEDRVSFDAAELAVAEFDKSVIWARTKDTCENSVPRPAVVTVMGHVDHGKTTLLDSLRETSVAAGEAGGITQHIGAFEVIMPDSKSSLTFLDTPGHAAFSAMRARGAKCTDLVVLVVAADDGVMPQTREALKHATDAGCPIVVAITKVDVPQANPEKVKQQLLVEGVELEEFGGAVQAIEVAATAGVGLRELEEALLLQAEMMDLNASLDGAVDAVVVEAHKDRGLGPVATAIVKRGTLKIGSAVVVGCQWGKVRCMKNAEGVMVDNVGPGKPAEICGLRGVPQAGDELVVVCDEERAKRLSEARASRQEIIHWQSSVPTEAAVNAATPNGESSERPVVNLVLKADTKGTAEAVKDAISGLGGEVVGVSVLHAGVGPVSEADVMFAAATGSSVMAFNVKSSAAEVQHFASEQEVAVRAHSIIYRLLDDVGGLMSDSAPLFNEEVIQGEAGVLKVFELKGKRNKTGETVAGCKVLDGHLAKTGGSIRVKRGDEVVHSGSLTSLKRHKLDVERVGKGTEFGAILQGFSSFEQGDVLQFIVIEKRKPKTEPVTGGGLRILPEPMTKRVDVQK